MPPKTPKPIAKEKSVGAIVFSRFPEKRFLLLKYGAGHWDFPKGHLEKNETLLQGMLRELYEETGISAEDVQVMPAFREKIHYFFKSKGKTVSKQVVFFLVESKQKQVKLSFEHSAFEWLPLKKAVERATFKTAKQLLGKASGFLKQRSLGDFNSQE